MIVKSWHDDQEEFELVHYKIDHPNELLLLAEDILDEKVGSEELVVKVKGLNKKESEILVNELKDNNDEYFNDPRDEYEN